MLQSIFLSKIALWKSRWNTLAPQPPFLSRHIAAEIQRSVPPWFIPTAHSKSSLTFKRNNSRGWWENKIKTNTRRKRYEHSLLAPQNCFLLTPVSGLHTTVHTVIGKPAELRHKCVVIDERTIQKARQPNLTALRPPTISFLTLLMKKENSARHSANHWPVSFKVAVPAGAPKWLTYHASTWKNVLENAFSRKIGFGFRHWHYVRLTLLIYVLRAEVTCKLYYWYVNWPRNVYQYQQGWTTPRAD